MQRATKEQVFKEVNTVHQKLNEIVDNVIPKGAVYEGLKKKVSDLETYAENLKNAK